MPEEDLASGEGTMKKLWPRRQKEEGWASEAGDELDIGCDGTGSPHDLSADGISNAGQPQLSEAGLAHMGEEQNAGSFEQQDFMGDERASGQGSPPDQRPPDSAPRAQIPVETSVRDTEPESINPAEWLLPPPVVLGSTPPTFPSFLTGLADVPLVRTEHAVPDTVLDGADLPGLAIRGASLRGDDHRSQQKIRQDAMGIWQVADEATTAVLVVVADGVGSEPLSHRGAADACSMLRSVAQRHVSKLFKAGQLGNLSDLWKVMAEDMADELASVAERLNAEPRMLSTTLGAALIETEPVHTAERRCVFLGVGDAAAYVLRDGEFERILADPHDGPVADTATWALPTSVGQVATASRTIRSGDMLMVCTDGMSNPMSNDDVVQQLAAWWGADHLPSLLEFGWQLSYRVRSFGDDRTAVCVWGR
jgi:serine/threonine protein phosphatase PrpC